MGHFFQSFIRHCLLLFVNTGQRFFTAALCGMLLVFGANCALTIDDLKWDNERATVHTICDTPTEIGSHVTLFAVNWSTGNDAKDQLGLARGDLNPAPLAWDARCAEFLFTMGARKKIAQSLGLCPKD
jgi:hypothetical protein